MDKFTKSFSSARFGKLTPKVDVQSTEDFPELVSDFNYNTEHNKNWEVVEDTDNVDSSGNDSATIKENTSEKSMEISENNGWKILTKYPGNLKKLVFKTKDELHSEYLDSLTPNEYHILAYKTFSDILKRRHEHDMKFIEIYGYDYFEQQYLMPERETYDDDDDEDYMNEHLSSDDEYDN